MTRQSRLGFRCLGAVRLALAALAVCALLLQTLAAGPATAAAGAVRGTTICGLHAADGSAPHPDKALCHDQCLLCAGYMLALGTPPSPPAVVAQPPHGAATLPAPRGPYPASSRRAFYVSRAPPQHA